MESEQKKSARTLLWSVLLSAPGPIVLGLSLTVGHSSTAAISSTAKIA